MAQLAGIFGAAKFGGFLKGAIDDASALNEQVNRTSLIFPDATAQIDAFAKNAAKGLGLSERAARDATSTFGGLLQNLGLSREESLKWSMDLTKLSADMASAFDKTPEEAITALGSALRGEAEPIKAFNVFLDDMTVREKAVEMGLAATTAEVDNNGKAQARLALIMQDTAAIQDDFANTSTNAANAERIAAAQRENSAASMGQSFLPIYERAVAIVGDLAEAFGSLPAPMQTMIVGFAGIVALASPVSTAIGLVKDLTVQARDSIKGLSGMAGAASGAAKGLLAIGGVVGAVLLVKTALDALGVSAKGLEVDVTAAARATSGELTESFLTLAKANIADPLDAFQEIAEGNIGTAKRLRDAISEQSAVFAEHGVTVAELDAILDAEAAAQRQANEDTEAAGDVTADTTDTLQDQRDAVDLLSQALDELQAEYDETIGRNLSAQEAADRYLQAVDDLTAEVRENGATLDANTEQGRKNRDQIRTTIEAINTATQAYADQTGDIDGAKAAASAYTGALVSQMVQLGFTEAEAREYVATLLRVPQRVSTEVVAFTATAEQRLRVVERMIENIRRGANPFVSVRSGAGLTVRAHGGPVTAGEPTIVGDGGRPEVFVPNTSGRIIPSLDAAAHLRGGASMNVTNVLNINAPVYGVADLERAVADAFENHDRELLSRYYAGVR